MKKLLVLAAMMTSSAAFAKGTTEYYFQPAAGASALTLSYSMKSAPVKTETSGTESDAKVAINDFGIDYAYGLGEAMALGAKTGTGSMKVTTTSDATASGMTDLHLYFKGFSDMIHYGVDLGVSPGKSKKDSSGNLSNRYSGGMSLAANVGVLMAGSGMNYGGDLSYTMPLERTVDNNGSDVKVTGGSTIKLAGFMEYDYAVGMFTGELSYNMVADSTEKATSDTKLKGESFLGLNLQGTYDFNEMVTGIASLGLENHSSHDYTDAGTTKVKAYMATNVMLGARIGF